MNISKTYLLSALGLSVFLLGIIPMACTNTGSNFNPTSPSTPVIASATPTNQFGFTSTPTFTIQPTGTPTNTPVVTPVTGLTICSPNLPNGIALNSAATTLYVAGGDGYVSLYTISGATGTLAASTNSYEETQFSSLNGVAVDTSGDYYVLDSGTNAVYEFNASNNPVTTLSLWNNYNGMNFNDPLGIAVTGSAAAVTVCVADTGNNVLDEFSVAGSGTPVTLATITTLNQWGYSGSGNGYFSSPTGIAIGTGAVTVYVADMENERIQAFNAAGVYEGQFATASESLDPGILGIAVDGIGDVFATDYNNGYVDDYNSTSAPGTLKAQWGGFNSTPNPFGPTGVVLNSGATTLYVSDYDNNAVYAVTP